MSPGRREVPADIPQFEHQAKYKIHDRWAQREAGPSIVAGPSGPSVKIEGHVQVKQEQRATRMEQRMRDTRGVNPAKVKTERFDDDYKREGRRLERVC